jgi:hypothetical protein
MRNLHLLQQVLQPAASIREIARKLSQTPESATWNGYFNNLDESKNQQPDLIWRMATAQSDRYPPAAPT